jgi:hypothetical protein
MHSTSKERYFFICLLAAMTGFLVALAVVQYRMHEPAASRVNWPTPSQLQH